MLARRNARAAMAAVAVVCLTLNGRPVAGQTHTSPIQVTGDGALVWVANPDSDSVGKISTATDTLLGEFPVGDNPRTVALDDAGGFLYVANQGSQDLTPKPQPETVMRLSQSSGGIVATHALPFGCAPYGVMFNPNGPDVYVSCERTGSVVVLDAGLATVKATISLDWPDPAAWPSPPTGTDSTSRIS